MKRFSDQEQVACWLCDYGGLLLGMLLMVGLALLLRGWLQPMPITVPPPPMPTMIPSTPVLPTELLPTRQSTLVTIASPQISPTPVSTPIPSSAKPEMVVVFIRLNWSGSQAEFEQAAQEHLNLFLSESQLEQYFAVVVQMPSVGLEDADLSSENLVNDVASFGLLNYPADYYIGLTDGDVALDGQRDVTGWTLGPNSIAVVAEASYLSVTAHELGHVFGLCDEYSYSAWLSQNQTFIGGCPNPYPSDCQKEVGIICSGQPTLNGKNSIMGPSGLDGDYGFNQVCRQSLAERFALLSRQE